MSNAIIRNRGSCILFEIRWPEGVDITGQAITAFDGSPSVLNEMTFTPTDERTANAFLPVDRAAYLGIGEVNSFRVRLSQPGGCDRATNPIVIDIR